MSASSHKKKRRSTGNHVSRSAGVLDARCNRKNRKATDDDVLEIRARGRAGMTMPRIQAALASRGVGLSLPAISSILYGRTYRELPGALLERKRRLVVTDGEVVTMREARRAGRSYEDLGVRFGLQPETVRRLCTGVYRPELPGAVKYVAHKPSRARKYSIETVRHIREAAAPKGCARGERHRCIAMRLQIPLSTVAQILLGIVYKEVTS